MELGPNRNGHLARLITYNYMHTTSQKTKFSLQRCCSADLTPQIATDI